VLVRVLLVNQTASGGLGFLSSRFWPAAAAVWTASVLALALSPQVEPGWLMKTFGDKLLHGAAFAAGAVVWIRTIGLSSRFSLWGAIAAGSGAALMVGAAIEVLQSYVPGRRADVRDLAADVAGILLGLALLSLRPRLRPRISA
jgi:VanZ family protein